MKVKLEKCLLLLKSMSCKFETSIGEKKLHPLFIRRPMVIISPLTGVVPPSLSGLSMADIKRGWATQLLRYLGLICFFQVNFLMFYHGKSPLFHHHFGEYVFLFDFCPTILNMFFWRIFVQRLHVNSFEGPIFGWILDLVATPFKGKRKSGTNRTRWWFQTLFIFTPIWRNDPI